MWRASAALAQNTAMMPNETHRESWRGRRGEKEKWETEPTPYRSGLSAAIDFFFVRKEPDCDTIFQESRHRGNGVYFGHLRLRGGGGLDEDVKKLEGKLYSPLRVVNVCVTAFFVVFNLYTIISTAADAYDNVSAELDGDTAFIVILDSHAVDAGKRFALLARAVAIFESVYVVSKIAYTLWVVAKYKLLMTEESLKHYRIYHQLHQVCCVNFRELSNFSAMKSLGCLNPQVLTKHISLEISDADGTCSLVKHLIIFVLGRLALFIFGFMAFTVKLALVVTELQKLMTEEGDGDSLLAATFKPQFLMLLGFVNQTFGIVQVWQIERQRLFLFIFGGEDVTFDRDEVHLQDAYLASCVYVILRDLWRNEPRGRGAFRRAIAVLGFSDLDVQALLVEENASSKFDHQKVRELRMNPRPQGRQGAEMVEPLNWVRGV